MLSLARIEAAADRIKAGDLRISARALEDAVPPDREFDLSQA